MTDDEWLWLEEIDGDTALQWVRGENTKTEADLFDTTLFRDLRAELLEALEADDRIPMPTLHGDVVVNFWTDAKNRRGLVRRTTWDRYRSGTDDWEVVLDVDALATAENESWVFKGASTRRPDRRRMLIELSPGGGDASVTREFDLVDKRFVSPDEGGFVRPLAKGWLEWIDDDTVYVGNDFGPGSLTTSGYPRTIRRWARGTALEDAPVVFEGEVSDISVSVSVATLPGYRHHVFRRGLDFYNAKRWVLRDDELVELPTPEHSIIGLHERWLLVHPRSDWSVDGITYPAGSLLAAELDAFLEGSRAMHAVFTPTESSALGEYAWLRDRLIVRVHEHVRDRLFVYTPGDGWARQELPGAPDVWTISAWPVDSDESNDYFLQGNDFVTPPTLYFAAAGARPDVLRTSPTRFDASGLEITQRFATSADGTQVPYFLIGPKGGTDAPGPTLLNGYGGFEVANTAAYSTVSGRAWLARGGTYVLANIRGGGEYGPRWHQAGLRENRHLVYEDFEAVARHLIGTGVTTPAQLGCIGGSNGGLLVGNMLVRCPELFGAIVCMVPLLDMKRYHHLLAGASWMAEYGDPDDADDWGFMRTFSPYHLLEPDRGYPPVLLTTSTRDDRVHPGHARKMAAALGKLGYDVTYWENIEGGHGGAADASQQATMWALCYSFLHRHLFT